MSSNSYDSSELSSILEKDSSGRRLAQYLMKKAGAPKAHRLFDEKERRISVQVELLRPEAQKQGKNADEINNENRNTENVSEATEPVTTLQQERNENIRNNNLSQFTGSNPPMIEIPTAGPCTRHALPSSPISSQTKGRLETENATENNVGPSLAISPNEAVAQTPELYPRQSSNASKMPANSPNRVVAPTPELFPRPILPQTPKSSQMSRRVSSSDRLRRLSFKHLIGTGAKRVLLNELNATERMENSSAFSEFEPALQNKQGCTSTPAVGRQQANLDNIVSNLNKSRREYNVQKGAIPGQIILTPSVAQQNPTSTAANKTVVGCEQSIELTCPDIANVSYGPRSKRLTNHNAISMILTDDEDNDETNVENDHSDKEQTQAMILEPVVSKPNSIRDATFVRPRSPIHKKAAEKQPAAPLNVVQQNSLESPAVSSSETQQNAGELADDENTTSQSVLPLLVHTQTRVQTEIFDDSMPLEQVSFKSQELAEITLKSRKQQYPKRRSTPDYIRIYRKVRKSCMTKSKKFYKNKSKRSLYSMRDDSTVINSPPHDEVTSTNAVATPARSSDHTKQAATPNQQHQNERLRRKRSSSNFNRNINGSKETGMSTNAAKPKTPTHGATKENAANEDDQPLLIQRRSRSRSKRSIANKATTRSLSQSSSSSSDEIAGGHQTATPALSYGTRSPSLPRQRIFYRASSTEQSETGSPVKPSQTSNLNKPASVVNQQQSPLSSQSSTSGSPTKQTASSNKSQTPETSPTAIVHRGKKRARSQVDKTENGDNILKPTRKPSSKGEKRARSPTKTAKAAATSQPAAVNNENDSQPTDPSGANCPYRRSQRGPKPIKIEPYAIEIYTRCYFPERFKSKINNNKNNSNKNKTKQKSTTISTSQENVQNTRKRKSDSNNLQPRVKIRRLNMNATPSQIVDDVGTSNGDTNTEDPIECGPNGINAWLQSSNVSNSDIHSETNPHQYDGHFFSRELLVSERHNDIEFRFYNHPTEKVNLGYIILKPKAVKKMVALRHNDIKFVCIFGEFMFKIKDKNVKEIRQRYCKVGDAFAVHVGDSYGIENLSATENGQIMMIQEKNVQN